MPQKVWTKEELDECYAKIRAQTEDQRKNYANFIRQAGKDQVSKWKELADQMNIELDVDSGRIRYKESFKPMDLEMEICYIRHGKTEGNTEPRVYQGMVDYAENQLNRIGMEQAIAASKRLEDFMEQEKWGVPDLIVSSPLQRAQKTAVPFKTAHKDIPYHAVPQLSEMRFGSWDNQKVANFPVNNICHLFYIEQNALVKSNEPHRVDEDTWVNPEWLNGETVIQSENFIECMQRQREALRMVERMAREIMQRKHPEQMRKPRVVIYGHSMAGAAISILMGYGQTDASGWLGFDGNYIMPNATPTLLIPERKEVVQ